MELNLSSQPVHVPNQSQPPLHDPVHFTPSPSSLSHHPPLPHNAFQHPIGPPVSRPNEFVKAIPSASPLVTPEMGERLCRMASQHYMSDYNRYKRGIQPNPLPSQQLSQPTHSIYPASHHQPSFHPTASYHPDHRQKSAPYVVTPSLPQPPIPQVTSKSQSPQIITKEHDFVDIATHVLVLPDHTVSEHAFSNQEQTCYDPSPRNVAAEASNSVGGRSAGAISDAVSNMHSEKPNSGFETPSLADPKGIVKSEHPNMQPDDANALQPLAQKHESIAKEIHGCSVKTSETHPMNISPIVPPELTAALADFYFTSSVMDGEQYRILPVDLFDLTGIHATRAYEEFYAYHQQRIFHFGQRQAIKQSQVATNASPARPDRPVSRPSLSSARLGNMLLSSCPGKKVRMFDTLAQRQAAGNRSPICRDLKSDLSRAQSVGIRAIICCLDDEELKYLGSPWPEYQAVADECGLVVIRIPMAEGYAPHRGIPEIDEVLDVVIERWTMNGYDVLCHCRGGVGRAGLVACCWMLKIGLINRPVNLEEDYPQKLSTGSEVTGPTNSLIDHAIPRPSVLVQVEKVIEVIRRRRSVKAIETPQQVHFIMEYANWLDHQ